jgi:hypothetical protein
MALHDQVTAAAVTAPITFLRPMKERPVSYQIEPPAGVPVRNSVYEPHLVSIADARPAAAGLSLDREGFALVDAPGASVDFNDDEAIRRGYYPQVGRVLREVTGAALVINFDHNIRNAARAAAAEPGIRPPVNYAHNDFTLRSGPERMRRELEARQIDAGAWRGHRFALINLWRPIGRPVDKHPLALCDARTIAPHALVAGDLIYRDRVGEVYSLAFDPAQRWAYFPRLRPEEAILIKGYDSADDGVARFTAHTAFDDPTSPADAPERESIEARALVIYPS